MDLTKLIFKREQFRFALANVTECFNDAYRCNYGCEDSCSGGTCDYTCDTSCAIGTTNEYNGCDIYNK